MSNKVYKAKRDARKAKVRSAKVRPVNNPLLRLRRVQKRLDATILRITSLRRMKEGTPRVDKLHCKEFYLYAGLEFALREIREGNESTFLKSGGFGYQVDSIETYEAIADAFCRLANLARRRRWRAYEKKVVELVEKCGLGDTERRLIPKVGTVGGYRPIGIPSHLGKIIERLAKPFLDDIVKGVPGYGFGRGDSCHSALEKGISLDAEVRWSSDYVAVMVDQSGAFDAASPEAKASLEQKLHIAPSSLEAIIKSTIRVTAAMKTLGHNKAKYFIVGDEKPFCEISDTGMVYAKKPGQMSTIAAGYGTPQGGVLSPIVFRWLQGDAIQRVVNKFPLWKWALYADDGVIFGPADQYEEFMAGLEDEMSRDGFKLNRSKCKVSRLTPKSGEWSFLGWTVSATKVRPDADHIFSRAGRFKDGNVYKGTGEAWTTVRSLSCDTKSRDMEAKMLAALCQVSAARNKSGSIVPINESDFDRFLSINELCRVWNELKLDPIDRTAEDGTKFVTKYGFNLLQMAGKLRYYLSPLMSSETAEYLSSNMTGTSPLNADGSFAQLPTREEWLASPFLSMTLGDLRKWHQDRQTRGNPYNLGRFERKLVAKEKKARRKNNGKIAVFTHPGQPGTVLFMTGGTDTEERVQEIHSRFPGATLVRRRKSKDGSETLVACDRSGERKAVHLSESPEGQPQSEVTVSDVNEGQWVAELSEDDEARLMREIEALIAAGM